MKALVRLPASEGIAARQAINIAVINPLFMAAFLGTAVSSFAVMIFALLRWRESGAICLLVGSLLYLVGCFLVTILFNVPRNEALASIAPAAPAAASHSHRIPGQLDSLESCSDGGGAGRSGTVHHRAQSSRGSRLFQHPRRLIPINRRRKNHALR